MFKNRFVLLAALALGLSFSAMADEALSIASTVSSNVESAAVAQYGCQVQTVCYRRFGPPYVIGCQTFGPGCTAYAQPGYSVQCTGYAQTGYGLQWVNYYQPCYFY